MYFRVLRNKEDKYRYKERFGFTTLKKPNSKEVIWIHASSVGEFKSSDFIINNFYDSYVIKSRNNSCDQTNNCKSIHLRFYY